MNIEKPNKLTPKDVAKIEKSRTISDAELLKAGADYVVDKEGNKRLEVTPDQKERLSSRVYIENILTKSLKSHKSVEVYVDAEWLNTFLRKDPGLKHDVIIKEGVVDRLTDTGVILDTESREIPWIYIRNAAFD